MTKLFVDTNVILDVLLDRQFSQEADQFLSLTADENFTFFISALSDINIHYQLKKRYPERECRLLIAQTKKKLQTIDLTDLNLDKSLVSDFTDFEDAVRHQSALYAEADYIITRNQKDFKKSTIPVFTPTQFLTKLNR